MIASLNSQESLFDTEVQLLIWLVRLEIDSDFGKVFSFYFFRKTKILELLANNKEDNVGFAQR